MNILILVLALAIGSVLAFHPRLRASSSWSATVTPLASIMGSGFLVSAPLLVVLAGAYAPLAMFVLLVIAYGLGAVIRFNIRHVEPELADDDAHDNREHRHFHGHHDRSGPFWNEPLPEMEQSVARRLEQVSHLVLAGAYLVSVSYYLQLLGVFALSRIPASLVRHLPHMLSAALPKLLATLLLAVIALLGWRKGLGALERVERYAVALNFGMITALIVGLALFNGHLAVAGTWSLPALPPEPDYLHSLRSLMGLLIIVQGFETSRFLGAEHAAEQRISTMRRAQLLSAVIYLSFITLALALFRGGWSPDQAGASDVTAIVGLVGPVASVLPVLIVIVAAASQFSAAVADDAGCAGLTQVFLAHRLPPGDGYLLIGAATVALTWGTDVLGIISLASRAFAAFYALQSGVALATALQRPDGRRRLLFATLCGLLGLVCVAVTVLGIPAE